MEKLILVFTVFTLVGCASTPTPERHPDSDHSVQYDDQKISDECNAKGWTEKATDDQQKVIDEVFAPQAHRTQHAFWHAVRAGLTPQDTHTLLSKFGNDWKNTHALCPEPGPNPDAPDYNPVGEDFLYMHHHMMMMLRTALLENHQMCIKPWLKVPSPKDWPLTGKLVGPKSNDALAILQQWDGFIQNQKWMAGVSLSQLGWALEFTIHNNLHMRYTDDRPAPQFRADKPENDGAPLTMDGSVPAKFNDPGYNWLADPYGAAVNPIFWKIHGYVDNAISLWLKAHGKTRIADNCGSDSSCYQWRGNWVGNLPELHAAAASRAMGASVPDDGTQEAMEAGAMGARFAGGNDLSDFNRQRLAHQRLGVLGRKDFPKPGGVKAPPPQDFLEIARQRICPNSN